MEATVKAYYRDFKGGFVLLLAWPGLWPDDSGRSKYVRKALAYFTLLVITSLVCSIGNFVVANCQNMSALVSSIPVLLSYTYLLCKLVIMIRYEKDVIYLNRNLTDNFDNDLEVIEYRPYLLTYYRLVHGFCRINYYQYLGFLFFGMSAPLVAAYNGKSARMYPLKPPFHYEQGGTVHWIIFAFEVLSGFFAVTISVGYESLFGYYAVNLVGQLRLLGYKFSCLKPGKNYRNELKACVQRHCLLMRAKNVLQRLFGITSIMVAVTSAVIVCALIFTLSTKRNLGMFKIVYLVDYIILKFFQAYMYAAFGNRITVESESCLNAIYYAKWAGSGDFRLMNDVLIIQSQGPMHFQVMGIMMVRLDMFSKIVNTSISYFFLLKTVEEKYANLS